MAVKKIKVHGNVRWRARVAIRGRQKVAYCPTKDEAKRAEIAFYQTLRAEAEQAETGGSGRPRSARCWISTRDISKFHRKPSETVGRARDTAKTIARVLPELLDRPVSAIGDADVLAFVKAREREGKAEVVDRPPRARAPRLAGPVRAVGTPVMRGLFGDRCYAMVLRRRKCS